MATTNKISDFSRSNSSSDSDPDNHVSMVVSRRSHALSVDIDKNAQFADSGATEHLTERREWFSTFKPIPSGQWFVAVADDRDIWVRGVGDIKIMKTIDGKKKPGLLKQVLFIPELK